MNKFNLKILGLLLITHSILFAQVEYRHEAPVNYMLNQPIFISMELLETVDVQKTEIFYRVTGDENFQIVQMFQESNTFTYEIPADYATDKGLEYAIVVTLADNATITFPAINAIENPQEILPVKNDYGIPILLAPDNGATFDVKSEEILVAISLFNITGKIHDISLKINRKELISKAEVYDELITLKYKNFKKGKQSLVFSYKTEDNVKQQFAWNFQVDDGKNIKPQNNYLGNVKAEYSTEQIRSVSQNIGNISTSLRGNFGKTNYNSKIFLTTREDRNLQPVNRYNFNAENSWMVMNFGDVYPNFSELTLYGNRIRGLESKLDLGWFNLHTVWGLSKRDVRGLISASADTVDNILTYSRSNYTFNQKVFGLRPSFDFGRHVNFGLFFIKAKDDTASVLKGINGINNSEFVNILMPVKPQESINLGMDLSVNLDHNRAIWENELTLSEMNTNIYGGALTLDEMDTYFEGDSLKDGIITISDDNTIEIKDIPFDPKDVEHIFTLNPHLEPLLPIVPDSSGNIGLNEIWNMPGLSALSKLRLNYFKNYVIIKYKKIGTKYNSLVNPYLQKDFREFSVQDRIRMYDDRIVTKIGYTNRINNYSMDESGRYLRNSVNFGFSFYSLGQMPNIDFDTYFDVRKNNIDGIDTLYTSDVEYQLTDNRIEMGSSRYNLTLTKDFTFLDRLNLIQLNISQYETSDKIADRLENYNFSAYKSTILRLSYTINLLKKSKLNMSVSSNNSDFGDNSTKIFNFTSNFTNMEKREKFWYFARYELGSASGLYEFINHKISGGLTYKIFEDHSLNFNARYSLFSDKLNDKTYNDYNLNLAWYYYFQ